MRIGVLAVLGWVVPLVLLLTQKIDFMLPSILCCGVSFVTLVVLVLFFHRYMRQEAERRFHL